MRYNQKGGIMPDLQKLKSEILQSGITMTALARKSNIERATLYNRLRGVGEFTASEIMGISTALHLTNDQRDDIFLS
jgi:DNA-binding phage protein